MKLASTRSLSVRFAINFVFVLISTSPLLGQTPQIDGDTVGTPPSSTQGSPASNTCNDACASAISKEYLVFGFSGDSSNVKIWNQTDSSYNNPSPPVPYQQSSVPNPPIAPYLFLGVSDHSYVASVLMDYIYPRGYSTSTRPNFSASMASGFTIGAMVYIDDPGSTSIDQYYSFVDTASVSNFSIERRGSQWGLSIRTTQGSYLHQFPWDANSFQTSPGWNYVFYTVTADGKCRIDVFAGKIYNSALMDLGNVGLTYNAGTATSNPAAPNYAQQLAAASYFMAVGKGFEAVALFNSPLSPAEVSGFYAGSYQGDYSDQGGTACNTGYALNVQTIGSNPPTSMPATPCGSTSNWSLSSPPGETAPVSSTPTASSE